MSQQGKTTGNLKMRSGPGMQFEPPIAYLVPDTPLEILGEEGDWWKVRAAGKEGYVGKKYVAVTEAPPAEKAAPAGELNKPTARPAVKVAPPKAISANPDAVQAGRPAASSKTVTKTVTQTTPKPTLSKPASKPSAPATKASTVKTTVTKSGPMPPKPPAGGKKK